MSTHLHFTKTSVSVILLVVLLASSGATFAQTILFGANDYVEYQVGTLPIVISVPHGGGVEPANIPDRTCGNPTLVRDANTIDVGRAMSDSIFSRTGCYPHVVYCHLRRTKLDANRTIEDGACSNVDAELAWTQYHHFIDSAQQLAAAQYADDVLYFDIHGHGHPKQRIEYGYLLEAEDLRLSDSMLNNSASILAESSIQGLVTNNKQELDHASLLRGPEALGTLLAEAGYPGVPSMQDPAPEIDDPYFTGGYSTQVHTTATGGIIANGVQLELNRPGIRDTDLNRRMFAAAFSDAVLEFLGLHTLAEVGNCDQVVHTREFAERSVHGELVCAPTIIGPSATTIHFPNLATASPHLMQIISSDGRVVYQQEVKDGRLFIEEPFLPGGYFIKAISTSTGEVKIGRVVVL